MSTQRNPIFQEDLLFLRVLIEGQASLMLYIDGSLTRFFYQSGDSDINQLVYKSYIVDNKIAYNNSFKQQLFQQLKCDKIDLNDFENLRYSQNDLERIFLKYYQCTNTKYISYKLKRRKDMFHLTVRPGINYWGLEIKNALSDSRETDFGNNIGARFGVETEFILPFNKNKWGVIIEPTYQYLRSEQSSESTSVAGGILVSRVNYQSIALPIGLRHYFYLNDNSKLFVNCSVVMDFALNSSIDFLRQDGSRLSSLEIGFLSNVALGFGYKYRNTYGIEMRYSPNRNILGSYQFWYGDLSTISMVIGYSFF